ncbi:hypothetical protein SeLEV6574_g03370 [Synchytrium endobioticum]|uniref:UspA domain-containing protein n=1 Tax=Synchytrium endobioticum TaxID=286115 RepID=A0A507CM53_9FUNG|nr:hypothetical protein SeLEV6574_g07105 [Synchytrium endobioticum]TPX46142.1 hypothetical protein SeLEV6574_g03370 [Synchytrium endobioticum]
MSANASSASLNVPGLAQPDPPKTVMMALDESSHSTAALQWVFDYLLRDGDKLLVVSVVDKEAEKDSAISRIKTLLRAIWESENVQVNMAARVVVGKASEQIVAQCEEVKPAFLVLSSAGKSHVEGLIVGSVSNYAISHVRCCPVIVARMTVALESQRGRLSKGSKAQRQRSKSPLWF